MIDITKDDNKITAKPQKDIIGLDIAEFREIIVDLIHEAPAEIVIDLLNVNMVDSAGIGVILAAANALKKSEQKLRVINVSNELNRIFSLMNLNQHVAIETVSKDGRAE